MLGSEERRKLQRAKSFPTKKDATDWDTATRAAYLRGESPFTASTPTTTVAEYVTADIDRKVATGSVRPRTASRYRRLMESDVYPVLGHMPIEDVKPRHVQDMIDRMAARGIAPRTIRQARAVLRSAYQRALRDELVVTNPVAPTKGPKVTRANVQVLTYGDVVALLTAAAEEGRRPTATEWPVALEILAGTAIRTGGELLGIKWSDLDLDTLEPVLHVRRSLQYEGGRFYVEATKTDESADSVPLDPDLVATLRAYRQRQRERRLALGPGWRDEGWLLDDGTGGPARYDAFYRWFRRLATKVGCPCRPYDIRHAVLSEAARQGHSATDVGRLARHADAGFTLRTYVHAFAEGQAAVAAGLAARRRELRETGTPDVRRMYE